MIRANPEIACRGYFGIIAFLVNFFEGVNDIYPEWFFKGFREVID